MSFTKFEERKIHIDCGGIKMTWPGEKQRHAMSARGISSTIQEQQPLVDKQKRSMEEKLEKQIMTIIDNRLEVEMYIDGKSINVHCYYEGDHSFLMHSNVGLMSLAEFAHRNNDSEYNDMRHNWEMSLSEDFFYSKVPTGPQRDMAKNALLEQYNSMLDWIEDVFPDDYDEITHKVVTKMEEDFNPDSDDLRERYIEYLDDRISKDLERQGCGTDFDVFAWRQSQNVYHVNQIRFKSTLKTLEYDVNNFKRLLDDHHVGDGSK